MSDTEYLCKDCKHSYINPLAKIGSYVFDFRKPGPNWYSCLRSPDPARVEFNSVTGQHSIKKIVPFCELERKHGYCGPEGRQWAPKHKKDLFKMLTKEHK